MKQLGLSSNTAKLHQMFGKRLYANKYSFISEVCQNAVDSHRMSGQSSPVLVGIRKAENSHSDWIFYVRDYGMSFESIEDFESKVGTLLETGKSEDKTNEDNCPMGVHGIGSIAVSAYTPKWKYFINKDKSQFTAVLQEIEGKGIFLDCSEYSATEEADGVLVEVPINVGDLNYFIKAMFEKLAYFKDILFRFDEDIIKQHKDLLTVNTSFKIFQTDDFQISTLNNNKDMHISLDQYSYPIKWNRIHENVIPVAIALRFGMGDGLVADITRENLTEDDNYKAIIKDKIAKVATWFVKKYNSTIKDSYDDLGEYFKVCSATKQVKVLDFVFNIHPLIKFSEEPIKHIKFRDVSDDVMAAFMSNMNYGSTGYTKTHTISKSGSKLGVSGVVSSKWLLEQNGFKSKNIHIPKGYVIPANIMKYIKMTYIGGGLWKTSNIPLKPSKSSYWSYMKLLNLNGSKGHMAQLYKAAGINVWREKIKMFQTLQDAAIDIYFTRAENITIPANTTIEVKTRKKPTIKGKEEVGIKYVESSIGSIYRTKFVEKVFTVDKLHTIPKFHVYTTEENKRKLEMLYMFVRASKSSINPVLMTKTSIKRMEQVENLHNFIEVDEFFKGKHPLFRRMMTSYIIKSDLMNKYSKIFSNKKTIHDHISMEFANDLTTLEDFVSKNTGGLSTGAEFSEELVKMTHEYKLYDLSVWHIYERVKADIEKFDFIEFFVDIINNTHALNAPLRQKALHAMDDCARHRKIRMHWEYYKLFEVKKEV